VGAARLSGVQIITGCDVQDTASVAAMADQIAAPVDILINNVGPALGASQISRVPQTAVNGAQICDLE
jgi:NAD(P)-dependent dehydrogenase (short-subunit alcohol dehydrogenase family)